MSFTGSWITIHNNVSTFFYKRQCCKLRKKVPAFGRKFLQFKFLQIFHLRERSLRQAVITSFSVVCLSIAYCFFRVIFQSGPFFNYYSGGIFNYYLHFMRNQEEWKYFRNNLVTIYSLCCTNYESLIINLCIEKI